MVKKIIIFITILAVVFVLGCSKQPEVTEEQEEEQPPVSENATPIKPVEDTRQFTQPPPTGNTYQGTQSPEMPPDDRTWLSPGKVNIANFHPGATASYPLTIHNGDDGYTKDVKRVTTEEGDTSIALPLNRAIYDKTTIRLTSDNIADNLILRNVDTATNEVMIDGLAESSERIIVIDYQAYTAFAVKYKKPNKAGEGYEVAANVVQDWVLIADMDPLMAPRETRDILITVTMPENASSPSDNWEFWLTVMDVSQEGSVKTELASRWLVSMRE